MSNNNCETKVYNNNRNRVFVIYSLPNNRIKILTYRISFGCPAIFSVTYFNKNDVINFAGDSPFLANTNTYTATSSAIWQSRLRYNQWRLSNQGKSNEWQLYQNAKINFNF